MKKHNERPAYNEDFSFRCGYIQALLDMVKTLELDAEETINSFELAEEIMGYIGEATSGCPAMRAYCENFVENIND